MRKTETERERQKAGIANSITTTSESYLKNQPLNYIKIHSLRLVGGSESEGRIVITSHSRPTTYMLIHQVNWTRNASRLVCKYLGYEGKCFKVLYCVNLSSSFLYPSHPKKTVIRCSCLRKRHIRRQPMKRVY